MNKYSLDFETPLRDIEDKIDDLKKSSSNTGIDVADSIKKLELKLQDKKENIYSNIDEMLSGTLKSDDQD